MDHEQLRLSPEILAVMRGAVSYAVGDGSPFVSPGHLLLAMLDDATLGPILVPHLNRSTVASGALRQAPPTAVVVSVVQAEREVPPLRRYDTLAFRSPDGGDTLWLDRDAFNIFIQGARRVGNRSYEPIHLALGYVLASTRDRNLRDLLGPDPAVVTSEILALD